MAYRRRGLNGEAKASSDVMINPFSPATTKAVIPDGKATVVGQADCRQVGGMRSAVGG